MVLNWPSFWRGALCGYLACLMTLCGKPAKAEPVAMATNSDGATVTLHDDAGPCVHGALLAVFASPDRRQSIQGCWRFTEHQGEPYVSVAWLDGDMYLYRRGVFAKAKAS